MLFRDYLGNYVPLFPTKNQKGDLGLRASGIGGFGVSGMQGIRSSGIGALGSLGGFRGEVLCLGI